MRIKFAAIACVAMMTVAQFSQAAPIQAVVKAGPGLNGNAAVLGLTGEIYISLVGPDSQLNRGAAADIPGSTKDNFVPGEVTYLNLGGFQGAVNMGNVVIPGGTFPDAYQNFRFNYQVGFTTPIVELQPTFVSGDSLGSFTPPAGVEGLWIVNAVPEPATLAMAGLGLVGMIAVSRRKA